MTYLYYKSICVARVVTIAACLFSAIPHAAAADKQIQLVMTGSNRAIVVIEGERFVLKAGDVATDGVKLLEADSEQAVL